MNELHDIKVQLRNGMIAIVNPRRCTDCPPFTHQGYLKKTKEPELWREDGRWREDGTRSPYDIIHVRTENKDLTPTFNP